MQTAIVIQYDDTEILVRVLDALVDSDNVLVDVRPRYQFGSTWQPYNKRLVEIRKEP